ncbi:transcriptional regulator [Vibrio sp. ZSDE26]|uniref:Transcriptional regulator n=1 Tax=Vibrio amylolyticus TaxID=2847292 RepID=A0A9X1XID6_9VIBR|nr:transcriptional regulator [Vibrio amylolyticus]MCK6262198.1 transcriptional regulator [Vibrio amylolyticus]
MSNIGTKFILASRFTFDPNNNSLVDQENDTDLVRLGSNESRILLLLCERPNEVITRNELHEFVWRDQGFEVDDSSLTQAISTLRKMLKDSTKSPLFVKTVPKRGYQLICSVEQTTALSSSKDVNIDATEEGSIDEISTTLTPEAALEPTVEHAKSPNIKPSFGIAKPSKLLANILLILAVLLPLSVTLLSTPSETEFRELAVYNDVPVMAPMNHPELSQWLPSLKACVNNYVESHDGELIPSMIIATGGQNDQIILNYIHDVEKSSNNKSVRIIWNNPNIKKVCK